MEGYRRIIRLAFAALILGFTGPAIAGGFIEIDGVFKEDSNQLTNPWWPLPAGTVYVYLAEEDDECVVSVLEVLTEADQFRSHVGDVKVRTLWDREFIDTVGDCDGNLAELDDWELLETTHDWYAQDELENIWYFGEHTVATDHEECARSTDGVDPILGIAGCLDGSWEAGVDVAGIGVPGEEVLEGIIMLRHPKKGQFYFQEFYEGEAEDMGKVLNFKKVDTVLYGQLSGCAVIKEWVPLAPGNVEHKYFCEGHGLVLVQGNAGGKTVWTDLVQVVTP